MPVLDTDTLTVIQRRAEPAYTRLAARLAAANAVTVATTVITFEEQLRGWLEYVKKAKPRQLPAAYAKLASLNRDFSTRPVLPFDDRALAVYQSLLRARTRIGTMDLKIAAISIANGELLLTKNIADFRRVPGLRAEDWTL